MTFFRYVLKLTIKTLERHQRILPNYGALSGFCLSGNKGKYYWKYSKTGFRVFFRVYFDR